ncbi:hypothetical protein H310_10576 [Aphanomyces invadans]|uniref:Uncharacterized protein n=1 Tax=Aphanomyces invadans TaxID=157072 RepID=A0A024TQN7_9STRA|nr:hypothetical protein H310_10576 [Aphanomyces invadans]ETV95911.1 hypothetical protein H310_10576 [Aphanomyces invadans]|eukprot:XP_008875222.1 hypothetical protein H310_10576 [Aphanomyces invadans]
MSERYQSRRSSASQSTYHETGAQNYNPSRDILVDSVVDVINSPADQHPTSVEFLYLPSGEILAKPSHTTNAVMPPAMMQIDMLSPSARYDNSNFPRPPSTTASTMSLREQALSSPASHNQKKYTRNRAQFVDTATPPGHNTYQQRILELEALLQNEKKRSLDKMRLLLDEQDKVHDLQTRFASLQSKVKSMESTISRHDATTRDLEASLAAANARHATVVVELAEKTNEVDRLTHEAEIHKSDMAKILAHAPPPVSPARPKLNLVTSSTQTPPAPMATPMQPADTRIDSEAPSQSFSRHDVATNYEATGTNIATSTSTAATQSSSMDTVLDAIRAWKEMADAWCRKSSLSSLDSLLLDFPTLPDRATPSSTPPPSPTKDANATVIAMLKRRLALVDKEYRHTHSKYIELKELCARQCVREADLQNFVNEHRLRGQCNLRLPSTQSTVSPSLSFASRQEGGEPDEPRRPMEGHVKVVIQKRERSNDPSHAPVISTTVDGSAVRAKLHSMRKQRGHKDDKHPLHVVVHPSKELTRRHQRMPTPQAKKTTKRTAPPTTSVRPWV